MPFIEGTESSGDFIPFIKFDARAGRWHNKLDGGDLVEITGLVAVFDLANARKGWLSFMEGTGPDHRFDEGPTVPPRPSDNHKRGFSVNIYSQKLLGGVREFSSNAKIVCSAFNALYGAYEDGLAASAGQVPVVACTGVEAVKTAQSTNYRPLFEIVKWIPRPAELNAAGANAGNGATTRAPAQQQMAPPPQQQAGAIDLSQTEF